MDPLTQGLLGAGLASSFAKKDKLKAAAICGALGGMAPDLDVFIRSANDQLLFIEYHRHFTHSLAFVPFGGLIVAAFLYLFFKNKASFKQIYIYTTLGLLTHGLLDACTSYGTRLLWPFSDFRVAWNIISIIDPIYTITLLIFLVLCLFRKSTVLMRVGLTLSFCYLAFGFMKHEQVKSYIADVASSRGHKIERVLLNPTIGNNILWRSVYQSGDNYYVDAVYMPAFAVPILQEGVRLKAIDKETIFPEPGVDSVQREDIRRFSYFSQGYIYMHPDHENMIADLRYGTLPYDGKSLWGIKVDANTPNKHVTFENLRNINDKQYDEFWLMLNGKFKQKHSDENSNN
jgi:inner membrane protein